MIVEEEVKIPETEERRKRGRVVTDCEIVAIDDCISAVAELDPAARARVIRFLSDRFQMPRDPSVPF